MRTDLAAGIEGFCSVPMWSGMGAPAGFCGRPAYGQQYSEPFLPPRFQKPNHAPYAPRYCCEQHGGPSATGIRFMRDGNAWMAFEPGFENLQESVAGFGATQVEALADLRANAASADTRPKGEDAQQASFTSGAVAVEDGQTPKGSRP